MQFNPQQPGQQGQSGSEQPYPQQQPQPEAWTLIRPASTESEQPYPQRQPQPQQPPEGMRQPYPPQYSPQQWQPQPPQQWQTQPQQSPGSMRQPQQWQPPQQWQQWQPQQPQGNPGQPMYAPQMQQPMYPYPPVQPIMMMPQQSVNVNIQQHQHGLFVRTLYFIFIGWWVGWIWLNIGYFFVLTVIGLPVGLIMLNRLPIVLTLQPTSQSVHINITGGTTTINIGGAQQVNFLLRTLYFLFVGWWAGLAWSWVAYVMFVFIVTIPVGVIMLNMLPAIITLRKN